MSIISKAKSITRAISRSVDQAFAEDRKNGFRASKAFAAQMLLTGICLTKMNRTLREQGLAAGVRGINRNFRKGDKASTFVTMTKNEQTAYYKNCGARALILLGNALFTYTLTRTR